MTNVLWLSILRKVHFFAASISGDRIDAAEELDASPPENNGVASVVNRMERWLLGHAQYLNFFTILVLASVSIYAIICCRVLLV